MTKTFQELKNVLPGIQSDVLLGNYTTFRIGGETKYFFQAETREGLILAVKTAKEEDIPFYLLGGGSNLLVSDEGFDGLVIKVKNSNFKIQECKIFAEAGLATEQLTKVAAKNNLSGLEWAAGMPGTVGGAIRGNAAAFGVSMGDVVGEVEVFDVENQKIIVLNKEVCKFGYRNSTFKENSNLIILSCVLQLKKGDRKKSEYEMEKHLDHRKKFHPLDLGSAGCVFENPTDFPVWKLIVECGLVGKRIGNVQISEKHSNFIVNLGNGKAEDVKKLIKIIKDEVKKKFGILLKEELQYL